MRWASIPAAVTPVPVVEVIAAVPWEVVVVVPVIDPATSAPVALRGRVVTMDAAGTVLPSGVVYARDGSIVAVQATAAPPPAGFEQVPVVSTRGTLFPGLIELHNHLPYDVLPLWQVPTTFSNRDQWSGPSTPDYHRLISGPMSVLGRNPDVVPAVVRYVETRCLLGGTTTSQGVALAVTPGIVTSFRGIVRNVEATGEPGVLPPAVTRIADIEATDAERFLARISGRQKLLLHLSEGTDPAARRHFLALQLPNDGPWAITGNLIGIHCAALQAPDFAVFAAHGGSMVWSPLSNLLLYGQTARVGDAIAAGVPIAVGSDWAPSGSKNLLGELKVARLAAAGAGAAVTPRDLVAMATSTPAGMLGWGQHLGTLEAGKRADLIVVRGAGGDPYDHLLAATEADIDLVLINGIPRAGRVPVMTTLGVTGEQVTVAGTPRLLNLAQHTADPLVEAISVQDAITRLGQALADLPAAGAGAAPALAAAAAARRDGRPLLAVTGVIDNHMSPRPHLPYRGRLTGPNLPSAWPDDTLSVSAAAARRAAAVAPLPALELDPLTAVDNPGYYNTLGQEQNLPPVVRDGLTALTPH
ncbi:MAG: amidohydrolase family protein [Nakamurella sp.]